MSKYFVANIMLLGVLTLLPDTAHARKARVLGCSAADLNTDGGSQCSRRGEQDILSGSSTVHVAVCSGGQIFCCITSDGSTSGGRCVNVTVRSGGGTGTVRPSGGGGSIVGGGAQGGPVKGNGGGCSGGVC